MPKMSKAMKRDAATRKARYAPKGMVSDRRPAAVREDRGASKRLLKVLGG